MAEAPLKNSDGNDSSALLKSKIKAIFFDLDNTLIATRSGDLKACRKLAEILETQFGFVKEEASQTTQNFLKSFRRCPDNSQTSLDSWRIYLWREALPSRWKHLAEQIYSQWLHLRYRYLAMQREYVQMLIGFKERGLYLALITNGPSNAQWEKIKKLKIQPYFDCVLVSSDLPWEKPNPHIFHAACNFLQVKPQECSMVGDKLESDIKGGCLAQLGATFWVPISQNDNDLDLNGVQYKPDYILKNVLDLLKYFPVTNMPSTSSVFNINGSGSSSSTSNSTTSSSGASSMSRHQISRSSTTSTCDSDLSSQTLEPFSYNVNPQRSQLGKEKPSRRYRRGGSLPAIECFNSENENSSDSIN